MEFDNLSDSLQISVSLLFKYVRPHSFNERQRERLVFAFAGRSLDHRYSMHENIAILILDVNKT